MPNTNCAKINAAYGNFRKTERAWRDNYNNAKTDKTARLKAVQEKANVRGAFEMLNGLPKCSYEKAHEIMADNFLGGEAVEATFGFKLDPESIPPIKFSQKELIEAKEHGEQLILRVAEDDAGNPMTMERMMRLMAGRMSDYVRVLSYQKSINDDVQDDCWYKDENFMRKDTPKLEWVLVGGDFVRKSLGANYAGQTLAIYNELKARGLLTDLEKMQFLKTSDDVLKIDSEAVAYDDADSDKKFDQFDFDEIDIQLKKVAALPINQNYRRRIIEVFYDLLVNLKVNSLKHHILGYDYYDSPPDISAGLNQMVKIGKFDLAGLHIHFTTGLAAPNKGVILQRRASFRVLS